MGDVGEVFGLGGKRKMHRNLGFGGNAQVFFEQQIDRFADDPFLIVLNGHDAKPHPSRLDALEHRPDRRQGHVGTHCAKSALGGLVRKAALRPQIRHPLG